METFVVRVWVPAGPDEDFDGLTGLVERPGAPGVPFHGSDELIAFIGAHVHRRIGERGDRKSQDASHTDG